MTDVRTISALMDREGCIIASIVPQIGDHLDVNLFGLAEVKDFIYENGQLSHVILYWLMQGLPEAHRTRQYPFRVQESRFPIYNTIRPKPSP